MGGNAAERVPRDDYDFALWEKRVDALVMIAQAAGLMTVDGLRRVLEDMGEDAFETMTYYERWVASLNQNLLEEGTYTVAELGARMRDVRARGDTYGTAQRG
ncbi:SH3-like domain-containing protein [Jannaschia sp. LMIT008]|uniref:SH3-like domain-containing protein n=1 Tax=Jannaschia maritima TaxID=3032585 RepID=UPI0028124191|nr:SH3-like domain-containing protein [Jannaschia sp. LMIT008]